MSFSLHENKLKFRQVLQTGKVLPVPVHPELGVLIRSWTITAAFTGTYRVVGLPRDAYHKLPSIDSSKLVNRSLHENRQTTS